MGWSWFKSQLPPHQNCALVSAIAIPFADEENQGQVTMVQSKIKVSITLQHLLTMMIQPRATLPDDKLPSAESGIDHL